MLWWIKCIGAYLCAVAFVMSVGLADSAIDEKARFANELDIKTNEAMIENYKAWIKAYEQFIKDREEGIKRSVENYARSDSNVWFDETAINKINKSKEQIKKAKEFIKEQNANIEYYKEYNKKLKAKSTNELIVLYSEGKEKNKSFEDIIKNVQERLVDNKARVEAIQQYLEYEEELWSPIQYLEYDEERWRIRPISDSEWIRYPSKELYKAELKARQALIKEEEARIKEFQTKLDIYYTLKANKLKN